MSLFVSLLCEKDKILTHLNYVHFLHIFSVNPNIVICKYIRQNFIASTTNFGNSFTAARSNWNFLFFFDASPFLCTYRILLFPNKLSRKKLARFVTSLFCGAHYSTNSTSAPPKESFLRQSIVFIQPKFLL